MRKLIEWLKGLFGIVAMPTPVKPVTVPKVPVQKGAAVKAKFVKDAQWTEMTKAQLNKLTKAKIEEVGRRLGIEIDKRKKKADLVDQVFKASKEALK
ncbi:MAG: hypothetical protein ACKVJK_01490 [Methylophagaceae bacterium]